MTDTKNIDTAKAIDFERLKSLVCERIDALEIISKNTDKMAGTDQQNEPIFRDLIMPCISILVEFIESVKITTSKD